MAKRKAVGQENQSIPPGEEMSKADAVRAAVAKGYDKPAAGVKFIHDEFGIEVTPGTFSATKSQQKARGGEASKRRGRTTPSDHLTPPRASPGSPNGTAAELAREVKEPVQRYGAVAVGEMVAVFAD